MGERPDPISGASADYQKPDRPPGLGALSELLLFKPGPEFPAAVERDLPRLWAPSRQNATPEQTAKLDAFLKEIAVKANDKLTVRLGWMTRAHPTLIHTPDGHSRLLVPLYSDGFDFSLIAITDDWGTTWQASAPIVGPGNVQPSIVPRKDGTLVAFFRDNGPPPQRVMQSESADSGMRPGPRRTTSSLPRSRRRTGGDRSGRADAGCSSTTTPSAGTQQPQLSASPRTKGAPGPSRSAWNTTYPVARCRLVTPTPSLLQAKDGFAPCMLHLLLPPRTGPTRSTKVRAESIKHVQFNEAWLLAPEGREPL